MKESNEILDRIELYSKGKMSLEEKLAFESELSSNDALRDQFEFSQIVDQMVIMGEALKLKEQMGKDLNKAKSKIWSYLTASVFVLATSAGLFYALNKEEEKMHVIVPISVIPKVAKQADNQKIKQTEIITPASPVAVKPFIKQEKKGNYSTSSTLSAPKSEPVFLPLPVEVPSSAPTQAVEPAKAVHESVKALVIDKDLCAGLIGQVEFYTVPSCRGQETGEVHLKAETVKGGHAPFSFTLGEKSSQKSFSQLASGQYSLFIRDANGCSVENSKKVVVGEKRCVDKKEYVFNPEYDLSWPIPYDTERQSVKIVIQEKGGKVFFQSAVSASHPAEWRGESNTGLMLSMGIYFFTIEYADGSVDEGSIVVSR